MLSLVAGACMLAGCVSPEDKARADKIVTALPQEVEGCYFIRDLDNPTGYSTIHSARFNLKLQAANLGATHIVEMHATTIRISFRLLGVSLSARAYKCPLGKGPLMTSEDAKLKVDFPMMDPEQDEPTLF